MSRFLLFKHEKLFPWHLLAPNNSVNASDYSLCFFLFLLFRSFVVVVVVS